MNPRNVYIFCDADGECTVKLSDDGNTHAFADILAALTFVRDLAKVDGVKLSVLDPLGRVTFEAEL